MLTLATLDRALRPLSPTSILAIVAGSLVVVSEIDFLTGYELSLSLFYLVPVSIASWYGGRRHGVVVAVVSSLIWYSADLTAGHQYSHAAIPVWNALVRLGFFLTSGLLLSSLRRSLAKLADLARTDSLTGLYSRKVFGARLKHDLALTQRRGGALTLAYVDLDDFKALNDTRGHTAGDQALRTIGNVLRSSVRQVDTAARLGGDEFALILPYTDGLGAQMVFEALATELRQALEASGFAVTCSIGVVTFDDCGLTSEQAVEAADRLMYSVKRQGKGAVAFSTFKTAGPIGELDLPNVAGN